MPQASAESARPSARRPIIILMDAYKKATGIEPTFVEWMQWALPVVVVMLPLMALWLTRGLGKQASIELPEVGDWRSEEVRTLLVFALTAALWITRKAPYGGWSGWANLPEASDASVALTAVVVMFIIPNGIEAVDGISCCAHNR